MQHNDNEGIGHCENHPDVNHLDVSSQWQRVGDTHEAKEMQRYYVLEVDGNRLLTRLSKLATKLH